MPHPKLVQDGILKAFIDSTALGPEVCVSSVSICRSRAVWSTLLPLRA